MQIEIFGWSPAKYRYPTWGGLYADDNGSHQLYVNIGTGTVGFPARVGATPEITLFTLKKQKPTLMANVHANVITAELGTHLRKHVAACLRLLDEGATIPFIARYRKEATGGMDEVTVHAVQKRHQELSELDKRKEYILDVIRERGALTAELEERINETLDPVARRIYIFRINLNATPARKPRELLGLSLWRKLSWLRTRLMWRSKPKNLQRKPVA